MTEQYTTARISKNLMEGKACTACRTPYRDCTQRLFTPDGRACCASCKNTSTHAERPATTSNEVRELDVTWYSVKEGDVVVRANGKSGLLTVRRKAPSLRERVAMAISLKQDPSTSKTEAVNPWAAADRVIAELADEINDSEACW